MVYLRLTATTWGRGVLGDDLEAADRWIDGWESSIKEQAAQAKEFSQRASSITVTARDPDGVVEVTVDSSGGVVNLKLTDKVRTRPAYESSEKVMATLRRAQAQMAQQMAQTAAEVMGAESETAQAISNTYASRFPMPGEDYDDAR